MRQRMIPPRQLQARKETELSGDRNIVLFTTNQPSTAVSSPEQHAHTLASDIRDRLPPPPVIYQAA